MKAKVRIKKNVPGYLPTNLKIRGKMLKLGMMKKFDDSMRIGFLEQIITMLLEHLEATR